MPFLPGAFQLLAFLVSSRIICGHTWWLISIFSVSIWPSQSKFCFCCCFVCLFFLFCRSFVFSRRFPRSSLPHQLNNSRHVVLWSQRTFSSLATIEFLCVFSVSFVLVENYRHFSNLLKRCALACGCCLNFLTVAGIWFSFLILCLLISAFFRFSLNGFSF